jgi:hypothetical protein
MVCMNEPKESVDEVSPEKGRANAWWRVRPMLQVVLLAEIVAGVALFYADPTSAALMRGWYRSMAFGLEQLGWVQVQMGVTSLAVVAVMAVMIEAARTGRRSSRRNTGGLKTASV